MVVAPAESDVAQLTAISLSAFQDAWMALHRAIKSIERYLEKKYDCSAENIEAGTPYSGVEEDVYLYVPACKVKVTGRDLEIVNFLKKARQFAGAFGRLGIKIQALPADAVSVLNLASVCEAQAKSLMSTCNVDLAAMGESSIGAIENWLLVVVTDLTTIYSNVKEISSV